MLWEQGVAGPSPAAPIRGLGRERGMHSQGGNRASRRTCSKVPLLVRLRTTVTGKSPLWDTAVDAFLVHCRGNGLRPATLEVYGLFLRGTRATRFREAHQIESPRQVTAATVESLKAEGLAAGLRPATVDDWRRVWRTFLGYCDSRGWLSDPRALTVKGPRQPKRLPEVFSEADEQLLLQACGSARDRFLVRFAIETGLRRGELCALTVDDFLPAGKLWIVRVREGKGGKERGVPLSPELKAALDHYLARVRPQSRRRELFLSLRRKGDDFTPLSSDGMYRIWNRLGKAAGVRAFPHKARHSFGTRLAQDGLSPWVVRESLGHATFDATDRYVRASAINLVNAFAERKRSG